MKNCQFFKQKYKQFKFAFDFNCICPYIWVTTIPENMKKLKIIAGPCLAESKSVVDETACELANIMQVRTIIIIAAIRVINGLLVKANIEGSPIINKNDPIL